MHGLVRDPEPINGSDVGTAPVVAVEEWRHSVARPCGARNPYCLGLSQV